jgi:hypothetical protein
LLADPGGWLEMVGQWVTEALHPSEARPPRVILAPWAAAVAGDWGQYLAHPFLHQTANRLLCRALAGAGQRTAALGAIIAAFNGPVLARLSVVGLGAAPPPPQFFFYGGGRMPGVVRALTVPSAGCCPVARVGEAVAGVRGMGGGGQGRREVLCQLARATQGLLGRCLAQEVCRHCGRGERFFN